MKWNCPFLLLHMTKQPSALQKLKARQGHSSNNQSNWTFIAIALNAFRNILGGYFHADYRLNLRATLSSKSAPANSSRGSGIGDGAAGCEELRMNGPVGATQSTAGVVQTG